MISREHLEADRRAERERTLETVPRLAPAPPWSSVHAAGERIGPFELIRPLGHGGMGEVWLARQADGRVEREVALKLPMLHRQGAAGRERFRRERDILARLEHPNIARLYDAGVTESGQPWLAMEFVEGTSISEHSAAHALSLPRRLALFRQVLAAVAHAHRHLVVHRDLKPANILIDAGGQVKLLDFGIATLLHEADAAAEDLTRGDGFAMTPRYAAPEQVAGEAVTTATDVYALAVILGELAAEGAAAGDLGAIASKGMRPEPAERYASVEVFDKDITAYLERRPVAARAGTWRYLAGRFVSRHRLPVVAAVAALLTLLVGVVMVERERRVAVAQKARAEKHFASVRKLANVFVFDVHAAIRNLPGSLKAQEKLIQTSLQYLDNLAGEAGDDKSLLAELAVAYSKIGKIQGEHVEANLGMLRDAKANFEKSRSLFVALGDFRADDNAFLLEQWSLYYSLARVYAQDSDPRWKENMVRAVQVAEQRARLKDASPNARGLAASMPGELAYMIHRLVGHTPEAELEIARSIAAMEGLVREFPRDPNLRLNLRGIYQRAGEILSGDGTNAQGVARAIELQRKALAICIAMVEESPGNHSYRASLAENRVFLSRILAMKGQFDEAQVEIDNALAGQRALFASDPKDATAQLQVVQTLATATRIAEHAGHFSRAIVRGREGLARFGSLPADVQGTREGRGIQAGLKAFLGLALLGTARNEGCALLREAAQFNDEVRAARLVVVDEGDAAELAKGLAQCAS